MEGADQILPRGQVDPGLAPDGRVGLRDDRRWYVDHADAPQVDRRGETSEIGDRPPTDAHDDVLT